MPPANTGSKGALITWTVVATVFGITCMVLSIVFYSAKTDAETALKAEQDQFAQVVTRTEIGGAAVADLRSQKSELGSNQLDLSFAINQARELAQKSAGSDSPLEAQRTVDSTVERVNRIVLAGEGVVVTSATTLKGAADNATQEVERLRGEVARLQNQQTQQQRTGEQEMQGLRDQIQQTEQQLATAREQLSEQVAKNEATSQSFIDLTETMEEQITTTLAAAGADREAIAAALDEVTDARDQAERELGILLETMVSRFGDGSLTTQADGNVLRSPSDNRLTIDLGRRQGVTTGMTFAVYDSATGVPKLEGDMEDPGSIALPRGKASIEIATIGETSSEARVIRTAPGQTIREGDLIANLAYDRDTPRRFYVYGEFDFNNDGQFSDREGIQIQGLIREFGGRVVNGVNVDTDIVVLGREPIIPQYTDEELQNTIIRNQLLDAQRRLQEYNRIRQSAERLNKTIVNQNYLLALTGYYEQARR